MRTPAGKECRHYYEDFHRGRNVQECRLVQANPDSLRWQPSDCNMCSVPGILNANASPDLSLTVTIDKQFLGLRRKVTVRATCLKHRVDIADAHVGCPHCNAERGDALNVFRQALDGDDD